MDGIYEVLVDGDALHRVVWQFSNHYGVVRLVAYEEQARASLRHRKWRAVSGWASYWGDKDYEKRLANEPEVPEDIRDRVRELVVERLRKNLTFVHSPRRKRA